jgi:hypothetical protein
MKIILLLIATAILAVFTAFAASLFARARKPNLNKPQRHRGFHRAWRKLQLLPIGIRRLIGWLPGADCPPEVQFANVGEGTHEHGRKSYLPNAGMASTARYLLYIQGTDNDHIALAAPTNIPLGSSDDSVDSNNLDIPITINLFGAVKGTVRLTSDGTVTNGCKLTTGANGQASATISTNLVIGVACFGTDTYALGGTVAAGDVFEAIPMLPMKSPF